MKNILLSMILMTLLISVFGIDKIHAQEHKIAKTAKLYDHMKYVNAQKIYLAVAEKGHESEELFTKLAESYYFNAQYDAAVKWYARLYQFTETPEKSISKLRYAQSLKATGNAELANMYYDAYRNETGKSLELKSAIDYAALIKENSGRYDLKIVEGLYDDDKITFGHSKIGNALVFASTSTTLSFLNRRSGWDGLSYLSLHTVAVDENNQTIDKPKQLTGHLKTSYHESSAVYTKDLNTMYFTRSNNTAKDSKNASYLKVYRTQMVNGKWSKGEELNFNSDDFSSAHPALSPDEKTLYFSSDRPGGYGASDLYSVEINEDGSVGSPVNLGPKINTPGKETFPFVDSANGLYFSSDGHFGLGGLDVFYVKIKENNTFGNLLNVGTPINSYADDFAFGIENEKGFVSSNRSKNEDQFVYDNIYTFVQKEPIKDLYSAIIEGIVTNKQSGEPLANATIVLKDAEGNEYAKVQTDANGYYKLESNRYEVNTVLASKEDYDSDDAVPKLDLDTQRIDFQLQQNEVALEPGTDLAIVLNIPIIYFDFDESNIRNDAEVELEKLVAAMEAYPSLRINVRSHTDSRGNDNYNQRLSERRAKSTMDYIVSKGISKTRLTSEGLGEKELINQCVNGVSCSEEEHQKNRRSEFIIIE